MLAHELGHLQHRRRMRLPVQVGALGVIASAVFGDFSSLLAAAPGPADHWLREASAQGIAIGSHPADAERIAFFRVAAAQR